MRRRVVSIALGVVLLAAVSGFAYRRYQAGHARITVIVYRPK